MANPWYLEPVKSLDIAAIEQAKTHQAMLTKPAGSLGELENLAISFAGWQGAPHPDCDRVTVRVFAADHGVCAQGVSAFPQQVTAQMIQNFIDGGAAISVLSRNLGANFSVINMGTIQACSDAEGLINVQLAPGTNDFTTAAAMSEQTMFDALQIGADQVLPSSHLFVAGEMGIGNTTSASAIYSCLLNLPPEKTAGPGTGINQAGIRNKCDVIARAIDFHSPNLETPLDVLQRMGGLEIAALVGAYISCAQQGIPILVDGFITTAAALIAVKLNPDVRQWMLFAHQSAEPAHIEALKSLGATPLMDLGMRLGEGSGAAVVVPIIQTALELHSHMATFEAAGVSDQ